MSKSLGNGIDPLKIIDKYGADALRFMLTTGTVSYTHLDVYKRQLHMLPLLLKEGKTLRLNGLKVLFYKKSTELTRRVLIFQ